MKVFFRQAGEEVVRNVVFGEHGPWPCALEVEMTPGELEAYRRAERAWDAWQSEILARGTEVENPFNDVPLTVSAPAARGRDPQ